MDDEPKVSDFVKEVYEGTSSDYTEISRIQILPFGMVNAHLTEGENGCIFVDSRTL